eukprot:gnl/TRDRNA2_/TRDRNA2_82454_c0_seq1.p1 gnl/TRDRNA2_/TRDRNA2_82454_c0~~gnl/TRDRNA2_/TRDRNA2_82454_c0_seq1.p1  ORF type:complete len:260 (-),score=40.11 gnl/TRDRNA2_/TRDRNA2_82454_c0_seq1:209-988(-)
MRSLSIIVRLAFFAHSYAKASKALQANLGAVALRETCEDHAGQHKRAVNGRLVKRARKTVHRMDLHNTTLLKAGGNTVAACCRGICRSDVEVAPARRLRKEARLKRAILNAAKERGRKADRARKAAKEFKGKLMKAGTKPKKEHKPQRPDGKGVIHRRRRAPHIRWKDKEYKEWYGDNNWNSWNSWNSGNSWSSWNSWNNDWSGWQGQGKWTGAWNKKDGEEHKWVRGRRRQTIEGRRRRWQDRVEDPEIREALTKKSA